MKIKFIPIIIFLITSVVLPQTTGKISGKVLDNNNDPVIGANVIIEGTYLGAAVGTDGTYFIVNIPSGSYTLKVSAIGFGTKKIEDVEVRPGLTTRINVTLVSSAVSMQEIVVVNKKPPIQKDLTSKMQGFETSDLENLPINGTVKGAITRQVRHYSIYKHYACCISTCIRTVCNHTK